jgi:uncharacterized GH25 family protein
MSDRGRRGHRPILLWVGPPVFAGLVSMWSLRHAEPSYSNEIASIRAENLPQGTAEVTGQLIGPTGAAAPPGITIHLAREDALAEKGPASWHCCPGCGYDLLDEQCERAPQAVAQMLAFGMSEIVSSRTAVTGSEGRFRFPMLPKGRYALWGTAPRGAVAIARNVSVGDHEHRNVPLESQFRVSLSGTVLASADGHPIHGARVSAIDVRIGTSFEATTDESGSFELPDLDRRETYYVLATARGMAAQGKTGVAPGDDLVLELDEAAALFGTVLEQGRPIKSAKVDVDEGLQTIETQGDGRFRFDGMSPGMHVVRAAASDRLGRRLEFELSKGLSRNLAIELVPVCTLKVAVEDSKGQPISGADVRLLAKNSIDHRAAKTDEDGKLGFELLTVGKYDLDVSRPDRGKISTPIDLAPDCMEVSEKLIIRDGPGVRGKLADEAGQPIAHADVNLEHVDAQADEGEETTRTARTDESGRFHVPSLAVGTWQLTASKDGFVDATRTFELKKSDVDLALTLPRGGAIEGRVLDPAGKPVGGWLVSAMIPGFDAAGEDGGPGSFSFGQRRFANGDGTFVFSGLGQKDYEVFAEPPSTEDKGGADSASVRTTPVRARAGDKALEIKTRGTGELSGSVSFAGAPPPESFTVALPGVGVKGFDAAGGRFAFSSAIAGSYPIAIHAPRFSPVAARVTVPYAGKAHVQITLHAAGHLLGRVVDARDGAPIAEATVASWLEKKASDGDDHPPTSIAVTRRDGHFELVDLAPGLHVLSAHADGYSRTRVGPFAIASNKEQPAIEIRLDHAAVRLAGRVLFGGKAVPHAFVSVRDPKEIARGAESVRTDSKGRFAFDSIEPGLLALVIAARPRGNAKETAIVRQLITVPASGVDEQQIDLGDHGGDRRLVVALAGKREAILLVTLRPGSLDAKRIFELETERLDPAYARAVDATQTEVVFDRVAPGSYTVSVSAIEPADDTLLGYTLARPKPGPLEHIKVGADDPHVVIRLE